MSESGTNALIEYEMKDFLPIAIESLMEAISLKPIPYNIIYQINHELNQEYGHLVSDLTNPYKAQTISEQIKLGQLDNTLQKFYYTLEANFTFNKIQFDAFKLTFANEILSLDELEDEVIHSKIQIFKTLVEHHFGNIRKILESAEIEIKDDRMQIIYPQLLEGYERILLAIDEKYKDSSLVEKVLEIDQIYFVQDEEELINFYDKNKSLLEGKYLVDKIENIGILTRLFSEGASIDVGIFAKEVLVEWRNEFSEITRQAREEKRLIKEEAKRKKIPYKEDLIDILYNEIAPRFLQKKNLKTILMEIKGNFTTQEEKVLLTTILKAINEVEQQIIDMLFSENGDKFYNKFEKNGYEGNPILYFVVLYKALLDNNIDFIAEIMKNQEEHYLLRMAARKMLYEKMVQNSQVKNPVGEGRVIGLFISSFEKIVLNDDEPIEYKRDNLVRLAKLVIQGVPEFGEQFETGLSDTYIKIFSEVLDINLVNKYAGLKKLSSKETEQLELLKDGFKLCEAVNRGLQSTSNKSRDQIRRNDLLLSKIDRKLGSVVKKIKIHSNILN